MSDLVMSGLRLTLVGMGMTFLSIGALVVGMFLLTRLTREKTADQPGTGRSAGYVVTTPSSEVRGQVAERRQIAASGTEPESGGRSPGELGVRESTLGGGWDDDEERRRAVAAAVAVSLALQVASGLSPTSICSDRAGRQEAPWSVYARGLHVSSRSRYESLRGRR